MATKLVIALCCIAAAAAVPNKIQRPETTIFFDDLSEGQALNDLPVFTEEMTRLQQLARNEEAEAYRLPTTTKPLHYNVLWSTNFNSFALAGEVTIQLAATQANVNQIIIHSQDQIISDWSLTEVATNTTIPTTMSYDLVHSFLIFQVQNGVLSYNANTDVVYSLRITFEGLLRTDMYGIYRSWYKNNNQTSWMASTQFQATAGRQAFPCYDEPSFKAYFDITLSRPVAYKSWSNMRLANTTASATLANYEEDVFYTTPYMSTYLIAIIIADYDSITLNDTNGNLIYEVIARPEAISDGQGDYAFEVGQLLLDEMSNHTDMDFYSVAANMKMTQAAIPDFGAGAMENWGLLTYREAYLLYQENDTSSYFKQIIAYILSHEIAHMWFGNLVTCDWWDVLWLNEGFARYYQYFLTHWVETDMGFETRFIVEQVHTSLLSDSANAHPLTNPGVGSPASVSAMFSTISYNKGAAIIRMTEHLLGFNVHRQGLRNYLAEYAFETALPIDLFQSLQDAAVTAGAISEYGSNFSVIDYYRTWTEQAGHPVLNVEVNHQTGDMNIQQLRFNINTGYTTVFSNWVIPITFASASSPDFSNTKPTHIITDGATVINRGSVGDEWVVFNKQQTGFYRVNYDEYTWNLIILALRGNARSTIHEYNRAQIVNDVFQFARSGIMTYNRAFNILSFLENETEYAPWVAATTGFSWIRNRLVGSNQLDSINAILQRWATNVMNDVGYYPATNESFMRSYLRWQLAPVMCTINVAACRQAATAQYQALRTAGTEVAPDSRSWVYCNALRDGTEEDFNFLWNRFQNHNVYTEKILILMSIGCTPHANSLNTYLDGIVQENELVRPQDYTTAFNTAVTGNEGNTQIVFTYIQNNLDAVRNAFGRLSTPLSYISARLRSQAEITAFQTWATTNQAALGDEYQTIYNGAENSRVSLAWAAAVASDLNEYIVNGDQTVAATTAAPDTTEAATTEAQPEITEPATPDVPDSAVTASVSALVLSVALVANVFA